MLTLLSVYSESARQDFLLPAAENVTLCARPTASAWGGTSP